MRKISVPKTNLQASIIVLGTDYFGSTVSRKESMQLMDHYFEEGGNVLDTAEVYASFVPGAIIRVNWPSELGYAIGRCAMKLLSRPRVHIQGLLRWTSLECPKLKSRKTWIRVSNG
jgi:hypothetical protein